MKSKIRDILIRAGRTFAQAFVGVLALLMVPWLYDLVKAAGEADGQLVRIDVNPLGNILIAAVAAGAASLVSFAQNLLEDNTKVQILPK